MPFAYAVADSPPALTCRTAPFGRPHLRHLRHLRITSVNRASAAPSALTYGARTTAAH